MSNTQIILSGIKRGTPLYGDKGILAQLKEGRPYLHSGDLSRMVEETIRLSMHSGKLDLGKAHKYLTILKEV